MKASQLLLALALAACNSGPVTPPSAGSGEPRGGVSDTPVSVAPHSGGVAPLDKTAVLAKLTGSRAAISHLKGECQLLYSDPPSENLGSIVNSQYQEALTWEAVCQPGQGRHSDCTVTLANDAGDDAEFMARYSFELDENRILIESSVDCIFAG